METLIRNLTAIFVLRNYLPCNNPTQLILAAPLMIWQSSHILRMEVHINNKSNHLSRRYNSNLLLIIKHLNPINQIINSSRSKIKIPWSIQILTKTLLQTVNQWRSPFLKMRAQIASKRGHIMKHLTKKKRDLSGLIKNCKAQIILPHQKVANKIQAGLLYG